MLGEVAIGYVLNYDNSVVVVVAVGLVQLWLYSQSIFGKEMRWRLIVCRAHGKRNERAVQLLMPSFCNCNTSKIPLLFVTLDTFFANKRCKSIVSI